MVPAPRRAVYLRTDHGSPRAAAVSVITLAELHLGVLMAQGSGVRARRLRTLSIVQNTFEPPPIDSETARTFAELVAQARRHGRGPKIMDTWIAATAVAHDIPVYTQDQDFAEIQSARPPGLILLVRGDDKRMNPFAGCIHQKVTHAAGPSSGTGWEAFISHRQLGGALY